MAWRARQSFRRCAALLLALGLVAQIPARADVSIPSDADWTDHGVLHRPGPAEAWHHQLAGIGPCALFEYDAPDHPNRLYLYHVGARGDRQTDGGPRHRAIGASYCELEGRPDDHCEDPTNWTLHPEPIVEDAPHRDHCGRGAIACEHPACGEEEGAWSCAVVNDAGTLRIYYGALRNPDACETQPDADNVAIASHVLSTTDPLARFDGYLESEPVIAPTDRGRACYPGDEWSVLGVFKHGPARWSLWSTRVADCPGWTLVHSAGTDYKTFPPDRESVRSQGRSVGGMDGQALGSGRIAWFEDSHADEGVIRVHVSTDARPAALQRVETFAWSGDGSPRHDVLPSVNSVVHLDEARGRWWLVYRDGPLPGYRGTEMRLKTAPVRGSSRHAPRTRWRARDAAR